MNIENILKEKKGTIVDVRTPAEFSEGNVAHGRATLVWGGVPTIWGVSGTV